MDYGRILLCRLHAGFKRTCPDTILFLLRCGRRRRHGGGIFRQSVHSLFILRNRFHLYLSAGCTPPGRGRVFWRPEIYRLSDVRFQGFSAAGHGSGLRPVRHPGFCHRQCCTGYLSPQRSSVTGENHLSSLYFWISPRRRSCRYTDGFLQQWWPPLRFPHCCMPWLWSK